ncbi:hypothetical protein AS156_03115 [Bradyrhizobium macuxiense]|uniref:DUF805 domain-containing protein n=2 Tax=Bradyrhizobium macuxiense TaxID=1755647 RepID=A0A109K140_9BRAD|nr:hypothetical protein AS156_03115 [Bradyrhizobium macuxiense]
MLGYLFGFNARIGRLQYFLASIALAVVATLMCMGAASQAYRTVRYGGALTVEQLGWPVLVIAGIFAVATFMLYCMRIRDIGWDPVVVVVGWIAFTIIDGLIASKFPAWAIGTRHQATAVGAFVNLGLTLALLFWPSGYAGDEPPARPRDTGGGSDGFFSRNGAPAAPTSRIARVANGEFGGRGK